MGTERIGILNGPGLLDLNISFLQRRLGPSQRDANAVTFVTMKPGESIRYNSPVAINGLCWVTNKEPELKFEGMLWWSRSGNATWSPVHGEYNIQTRKGWLEETLETN